MGNNARKNVDQAEVGQFSGELQKLMDPETYNIERVRGVLWVYVDEGGMRWGKVYQR